MTKYIHSSKVRIIVSFAFSLLILFLSDVFLIRVWVYSHPLFFATVKLIILDIFLLSILTFLIYFLIKFYSELKSKWIIFPVLITSGFIANKSLYCLANIDRQDRITYNYVIIGEYLAKFHGMNIFFMDLSGWKVLNSFVLTILYSVVLILILKKIRPILFTKKKSTSK